MDGVAYLYVASFLWLGGIDVACGQRASCNLTNHIKANMNFLADEHPPYKDYKGGEGSVPLPRVAPFTKNTEEEINKQINRELFAHYTYLSMAMHFDRDDINLPGFKKFFKESSEEELKHAQQMMEYQNKRGGRVKLHHIMTPCLDQWGNGLNAMEEALKLEKEVYRHLLELHETADKNRDPQLQDFLESEFLGEQVESIKELSDHVNTLKRMWGADGANYPLGEYQFDEITLKGGKAD